ncbi:MAG TPA: M1 family aminopeptidase [Candidatus Krumholzibacteria bacterium]|nr:M1 family aminopeptidase [Candidatus Krumholzibacteria bacterium]
MPPRPPQPAVRSRSLRLVAVALALLAGTAVGLVRAFGGGADPTLGLRYEVAIDDPATGRIAVSLHVTGSGDRIELGTSDHVLAPADPHVQFRVREARDPEGRPLEIVRHAQGWDVETRGRPARIDYEVHLHSPARHRGSFAREALSSIDVDGARLLGSDVFVFPLTAGVDSLEVRYDLPPDWTLHHPFATDATTAAPPSLPALYGSAVAVGRYRHLERQIDAVRVELALRGNYAFGDADLMDVVERVVRHQVELFGHAPSDRYLFVVNEHPAQEDPELLHYFGLHFRASMVLLIDPRTRRRSLQGEPASLCAHEFFHNWLGEELRQQGYEMNWFVEGVTTLYAYRTQLATGMLDHGRFAREVRRRHRDHWVDNPARARMSLSEAGSVVLQDPEVTRLTYTGGLLVGIALDERIAAATAGRTSLDDLLVRMVDRARHEPRHRLTRATLEAELLALTGEDFGPWLDRHVDGIDRLPLPGFVTSR